MSLTFKKPYDKRERHFVDSGRPVADKYQHEINKHGMKVLVKTGTTDVYQKIQEAYEETKIENIIARVTAGDTSMLRANGQWIDTTELPNNLIEARQAIQKLENTWNGLSADIKRNYNFSLEEFITKAGTQNWLEDLGYLKKSEPKKEAKTEAKSEPKKEAKGDNEA